MLNPAPSRSQGEPDFSDTDADSANHQDCPEHNQVCYGYRTHNSPPTIRGDSNNLDFKGTFGFIGFLNRETERFRKFDESFNCLRN